MTPGSQLSTHLGSARCGHQTLSFLFAQSTASVWRRSLSLLLGYPRMQSVYSVLSRCSEPKARNVDNKNEFYISGIWWAGRNSHLGARKKKTKTESLSPSQSYERTPRHASFYLPISIYLNKPDPLPWVNRFLNYVSKAFFWLSPVILGHSITVLKGRNPDVTMTDKTSQSGAEKWYSKILESNPPVLRSKRGSGRRTTTPRWPCAEAARAAGGAAHSKAEGRGSQDFLFERQQVGGTRVGRAVVESLGSFVSGGGVARAELGVGRAERDVGDASASSSAACEVSGPGRPLAVERRVRGGRWSLAARSQGSSGRGGDGEAVAATAGGGGRGRAGGPRGGGGSPRSVPVKRPCPLCRGPFGEAGREASRRGAAPLAPQPFGLSVPASRSCSGSSILASAVTAAGRMCRLLAGGRRRRRWRSTGGPWPWSPAFLSAR